MAETGSQSTISSQFTIKRLFWTLIVASVVFKLADMTGLLRAITNNWDFARGNHKVLLVISILAFALIALVYIAWFGIRLPYLIERYVEVRKKREQRREEFREEYEAWKKK